jgi:rod shape-determining protein MreC
MRTRVRRFAPGAEWIVFIIAVGISLMFLLVGRGSALKIARQEWRNIAGFFARPLRFVPQVFTLWRENRLLSEQVMKLNAENSLLREVALENERLRGMLDFRQIAPWTMVPAEVIGHPGPGIGGSVVLNIGARKGIMVNAAVMTPRGLVGKVVDVGPYTCLVQTIRGKSYGVSLIIERTRVQGILKWLERDVWILDGVPTGADIRMGDLAVTTGQGGVFPTGIRVAVVSGLRGESSEQFKDVRLRPLADLQTLEEVFVLLPKADEFQMNSAGSKAR